MMSGMMSALRRDSVVSGYEAGVRSNYFQVVDPEAFRAFCQRYGVQCWQGASAAGESGREPLPAACARFGFGAVTHDGLPPADGLPPESSQDPRDAFLHGLASHLAVGEVAIVMEVGRCGLEYFVALGYVVDSQGHIQEMNLAAELEARAQVINPRAVACCDH